MDFCHRLFHILGIKKNQEKENFSKSLSPIGLELSF